MRMTAHELRQFFRPKLSSFESRSSGNGGLRGILQLRDLWRAALTRIADAI